MSKVVEMRMNNNHSLPHRFLVQAGVSTTVSSQRLAYILLLCCVVSSFFLPIAAIAQSPSTTVLDDFNRTDENPITGGWTNGLTGTGDCQIITNTLRGSTGTEDCYWNTAFGEDQEVFVTFSNASNHTDDVTQRTFMCLQDGIGTGTVDGYGIEFRKQSGGNDRLEIFKMDNATSFTRLGTGDQTKELADGDKLWLKRDSAGNFTLYYNGGGGWSQIDSVNDTTYTCANTYIGIRLQQANYHADDFGGGNITAGGGNNLLLGITPLFMD